MIKVPIIDDGRDKKILFSHFDTDAHAGTWKKENLIFPDDIKINVFVEGEFNVFSDDKNHNPVYGDICVFSPQKMHYGHITKQTHLNYYQLDIGIHAYDGIPQSKKIIDELIVMVNSSDSFTKPQEADRREIYHLCEKIQMCISKENFAVAYIKSFEFILLLHKIYSSGRVNSSTALSYHVNRVIKYIETNFGENITVSSIAKKQGISEGYLSRSFKNEMRMTIHEYLTRYRLFKAAEFLKEYSVAQVCFMCGFCDSSHFITVFKKHIGCTPMKYKKIKDNSQIDGIEE